MSETPETIEPPADFADPRESPEFKPERWPLCNGEQAPTGHQLERHDRRCLEFLAAFYFINLANVRLLEARHCEAGENEIEGRTRSVSKAMSALEQLEDRYAPVGFFGEPLTMDGIFYKDIKFVRPGIPHLPDSASRASSEIRIPGLEFLPPSELEGEITITRWP